MKKPGTIVTKEQFMDASMKFYFADRYERSARQETNPERAELLKVKSAKLNDQASRILGFVDYNEFEEFHENNF